MTDYVSISFAIITKFAGGEGLTLFIKIGDEKYLKVCHHEESHTNIVEKYEGRGATCFYLTEDDYKAFIERVRQGVVEKEASSEADTVRAVPSLNSAYMVLQSVFSKEGIGDEGKDLAREITKGTMKVVSGSNLVGRLKEFMKDCNAEYLHALLTSFVACNILSTFPWGNAALKEKVVMASIFCDILLTPEDFEIIYHNKGDPSTLPKHIFSHPNRVADALGKESRFVAPETLTIIRQHHERPNGKGYPRGLGYNEITVLTAVYIVSNYLVEQIFREDLAEGVNTEKLVLIAEQIKEKFCSGNFRKASEALESILF